METYSFSFSEEGEGKGDGRTTNHLESTTSRFFEDSGTHRGTGPPAREQSPVILKQMSLKKRKKSQESRDNNSSITSITHGTINATDFNNNYSM